jgi:hypothetical protein
MADIAVISVVSSGIVGVLGAAGGVYAQRVTLRVDERKRLEERRSDLRTVLDQAAVVGMSVLDAFEVRGDEPGLPALKNAIAEVKRVSSAIVQQRARLGVRVGPGSALYREYAAFADAVAAVTASLQSLERAASGQEDVAEPRSEAVTAARTAREAFGRFLAQAAGLAGLDAPLKPAALGSERA